MADTFGPPAKRLRLDNGASNVDVPGSPIDDMDDDFYETTPIKPAPRPIDAGDNLSSDADTAPAPTSLSSLSIPGLGLLSNSFNEVLPVKHTLAQAGMRSHDGDEDLEDGELSDTEVPYNNAQSPKLETVDQPHGNGVPQRNDGPEADLLAILAEDGKSSTKPALWSASTSHIEVNDSAAPTDTSGLPQGNDGKVEFLRAAEANKGNKNAEWELDSQGSDASSGSSSSDDSSDDDEDSDEGELLDPEEQVRRLMMESAEDPATAIKAKVQTLNEVAEVFEKPDITITDETKITELGKVESIVDNMILIKASVSGNYQVLESGSALCLGNRTIVGKVCETMGRVQEPRYSVGFTDPTDITTLGIAKGTTFYYVNEHSTFVLTEPLRDLKFTDASNLHDEETNEIEFSDDEKEAEHKKKQKEAKRARTEANRPQEKAQLTGHADMPPVPQPNYYQGGGLNYSDDDEDLGMYKPLPRPDHFEDIVGAGAPLEDRSHVRRGNTRGGRGGWVERGRGSRGRGGGGGQGGGRRGNQGNQFSRGQPDRRGRQSEHNRQRGGNQNQPHNQQRESRSTSAASPNRQNQNQNQNRGRLQPQHSPSRGSKRKRQHASPSARGSLPPVSVNANAYAQSNASSSNVWSTPNSNAPQSHNSYTPANPYAPATSYASANSYAPTTSYTASSSYTPANSYAPTAPSTIPAGSYVNPAFYAQPAAASAAPPNQQQQHIAQWAQWLQAAQAAQAAAAIQNQAQSQPSPVPTGNAPQGNPQAGGQSLQDILRALGGAQGR